MPEYLYNVGSSNDITIEKLAKIIQKQVGHNGNIKWDLSKPDGTQEKLIDSSKINNLGWRPKYDLETGIKKYIFMVY